MTCCSLGLHPLLPSPTKESYPCHSTMARVCFRPCCCMCLQVSAAILRRNGEKRKSVGIKTHQLSEFRGQCVAEACSRVSDVIEMPCVNGGSIFCTLATNQGREKHQTVARTQQRTFDVSLTIAALLLPAFPLFLACPRR